MDEVWGYKIQIAKDHTLGIHARQANGKPVLGFA